MNCTVQSCVSFVLTMRASPRYGRVLMFSLRTEIYVCAHARAAGRDTSHLIELVKINNMLQKFPMKLQCYEKRFGASMTPVKRKMHLKNYFTQWMLH